MSTAAVITLSEYLETSYRPDREFLEEVRDGILRTGDPDISVPLANLE